jgi:hypothetical protein
MSFHRQGATTKKLGPRRHNPLGKLGSRPISALLVVAVEQGYGFLLAP